MKLLYKFILAGVVSLALTSCNFLTTSKKVDFLYSNFQLQHVHKYDEELIEMKQFIPVDASTNCDSLFKLSENYIQFHPIENDEVPTFSMKLSFFNGESQTFKDIPYSVMHFSNKNSRINFDLSCDYFTKQEAITSFNFWLRIHALVHIESAEYNVIFEYRNVGDMLPS